MQMLTKEYVMEDFEATPVACDAIRLDSYDDDLENRWHGRYTKIVSLSQAMSMVIVLVKAIEAAELGEAMVINIKGKRKRK
jgi:hypothetical protein